MTATDTLTIPTATPTWTDCTPTFDRPLTDDELAHVIARVRSTDHEQGIVAALAVFDIAAADQGPGVAEPGRRLAPVAAIPLHQWKAIQAVIDSEARRRDPSSGSSAVLADWVDFGPRISAR